MSASVSISQYAARAEAAEAKIAELTNLAAQIQAVAGGAGASSGGEGIGEFKAYFLEKLKVLRVSIAEEHEEFLQEKAKNADLDKEVTKLRYRVEILTRELAKVLGTPVPESIFKASEAEATKEVKEGEKEKDKKGKDKEKDKEKGKDKEKEKGKDKDKEKEKDKGKDKEKDKEKGKDKEKEKGKDKEKEKGKDKEKEKEKGKDERKPSEKAERKPSERKQSEKVEVAAEPKADAPNADESAVRVHAAEAGKKEKPAKGGKKDEGKKEAAAEGEQGKKDNKKGGKKEEGSAEAPKKEGGEAGKKGEKQKKDSTRTESEKGEAKPKKEEGGKKGGDAGKKGDAAKKGGDNKKEEPKVEAKSGDLDEKAVKACIKEGGKKAQDCAGMSTFGTHFFCVTIESADGNMKLLEKAMEGMNVEVDPEAEDRKGGAGDLGKILFNANDDKLIIMCHTPKEVMEKATAAEWMQGVLTVTGAKVISQTDNFIQAELDNDPDHGVYVLKLRDQGISASFEFLRSRGLMIEDDSEDENYAAAAGINLNAAPGADY
jgi:hypothetical protein